MWRVMTVVLTMLGGLLFAQDSGVRFPQPKDFKKVLPLSERKTVFDWQSDLLMTLPAFQKAFPGAEELVDSGHMDQKRFRFKLPDGGQGVESAVWYFTETPVPDNVKAFKCYEVSLTLADDDVAGWMEKFTEKFGISFNRSKGDGLRSATWWDDGNETSAEVFKFARGSVTCSFSSYTLLSARFDEKEKQKAEGERREVAERERREAAERASKEAEDRKPKKIDGWDKIKFGMTMQQVLDLYPNALQKQTDDAALLKNPVEGVSFASCFFTSVDQLYTVMVILDTDDEDAIVGRMNPKYGKPEVKDKFSGRQYIWSNDAEERVVVVLKVPPDVVLTFMQLGTPVEKVEGKMMLDYMDLKLESNDKKRTANPNKPPL